MDNKKFNVYRNPDSNKLYFDGHLDPIKETYEFVAEMTDDEFEKYKAEHEAYWILKSYIVFDELSYSPYIIGPVEPIICRSRPPIYWGTKEECDKKFKELVGDILKANDLLTPDQVLKAWLADQDVEVYVEDEDEPYVMVGSWEPLERYSSLSMSNKYRIKPIKTWLQLHTDDIDCNNPSLEGYKKGYICGAKGACAELLDRLKGRVAVSALTVVRQEIDLMGL